MPIYYIEILIESDSCIGCKSCIKNCPNNVFGFRKEEIYLKNEKDCDTCMNFEYTFDKGIYEKDIGNFECIKECPFSCISINLNYKYQFWENIIGFLRGNYHFSDKLTIFKESDVLYETPFGIDSNPNIYFEDDIEYDLINLSSDFKDLINNLKYLEENLVLNISNEEIKKSNAEIFAKKLYNFYLSISTKQPYKKEDQKMFHNYLNFLLYVLNYYPLDIEGNTFSDDLHNKWFKSVYSKHISDLTSSIQTEIPHFITMSKDIRKEFYRERRDKNFFKKLYEIKSKTKKNLNEEELKEKNYLKLIEKGESEVVEFKSTFKWDINEKRVNKELPKKVCESINAFLNSRGGVLFIGIQDNGEIYGLNDDIKNIFKNNDNFLQTVSKSIKDSLGGAGIDSSISIIELKGKEICMIEVKPSEKPVFIEKKDFFVRRGTSNHRLNTKDFLEYYQSRFFKK